MGSSPSDGRTNLKCGTTDLQQDRPGMSFLTVFRAFSPITNASI
jgi:hypothetical protein